MVLDKSFCAYVLLFLVGKYLGGIEVECECEIWVWNVQFVNSLCTRELTIESWLVHACCRQCRNPWLTEVLCQCHQGWSHVKDSKALEPWEISKAIAHMVQGQEKDQSFSWESVCSWWINQCKYRLATTAFHSQLHTAWDCSPTEPFYRDWLPSICLTQ